MDISSNASTAPNVITPNTNSGVLAVENQTTSPENMAAHRYMISTLSRCECPMSSSR
jgi:hypothetical protein